MPWSCRGAGVGACVGMQLNVPSVFVLWQHFPKARECSGTVLAAHLEPQHAPVGFVCLAYVVSAFWSVDADMHT